MKVRESVDWLDSKKWKKTSAEDKLKLLKQVRENLKENIEELAKSDNKMKNLSMNDKLYDYQTGLGYQGTAVGIGTTINACIDLYESIIKGSMMAPIEIKKVSKDLYDIHVFPQKRKDKIMYADRQDYLRVKGKPKQVNPMDRKGGIAVVLGAGNYSSPVEMINAIFLENMAVVHKPHHLNQNTDKIWEKIMKPLVDYRALSFCEADGGRKLVLDKRLSKIYFTGGHETAKKIMASTKTEVVSECGGNNPCIIVPGNKEWTKKEMRHQVLQKATMAKLNGGAVCGRPQTIITNKNWNQREEFLKELERALEELTPAATSYYPRSEEVASKFLEAHLEAKILKPEGGRVKNSEIIFIRDVDKDSYAVKNEAFCQVVDEIAIDTSKEVEVFLKEAVKFCNSNLHGTLGSSIIIDDEALKQNRKTVEKAVTDMQYGAVGVNTMPPIIYMNPYLTWGGNEEGKELISGRGNFGNLLCFENVEKSIVYSSFMSAGHMMSTNKKAWKDMSKKAAQFAGRPTWGNFTKLALSAAMGNMKRKDF